MSETERALLGLSASVALFWTLGLIFVLAAEQIVRLRARFWRWFWFDLLGISESSLPPDGWPRVVIDWQAHPDSFVAAVRAYRSMGFGLLIGPPIVILGALCVTLLNTRR
jgi:hypothetical protein